jgi:AcrR family transcriptional regulator
MTDNPHKRGRGRPRREGADDEILAVTLAMLRESGYGALTVDTVAELSGVAKTTLYRRWPSKSALVAAAIAPLAAESHANDVEGILRETVALVRLFSDADAEAIEVIAAVLRPRHQRLRALAGDAKADALIGGLLVRLIVTREPLDDDFAAALARLYT